MQPSSITKIIERPGPTRPAPKDPLTSFIERLYRLRTDKFGREKDIFIIIETSMEIYDVVELCKKYCNRKQMRFLGVTPLFEIVKEEQIG